MSRNNDSFKTIFDSAAKHKVCIEIWESELIHLDSIPVMKTGKATETEQRDFKRLTRKYIEVRKREHEEALQELIKIIAAHEEAHPENLEKKILYMHYIEGRRLEDIAEQLNYSSAHIARVHAKIIKPYLIKERGSK